MFNICTALKCAVCVCYVQVPPTTYLQVPLPGVFQVLHGAALSLLQTLLSPLVLRLQLVQLHPQVLPLLAELVLQLLQRRLRLGQLHLQTLLQQGDLGTGQTKSKRWTKSISVSVTLIGAGDSQARLDVYTYIY